MPLEIEMKFRLTDPGALRRRLAELGAQAEGKVLEQNTYFDTPDGSLRRSDRGLRIRSTDGAGATGALLTFKGPRRPGPTKTRHEEELRVESPDAARAILEGLGYRPAASFQKRREGFRLEGAQISLDELPELGFFVEIEAGDNAAVQRVRERLGLGQTESVTATYVALVVEHLQARGRGDKELNFPRA